MWQQDGILRAGLERNISQVSNLLPAPTSPLSPPLLGNSCTHTKYKSKHSNNVIKGSLDLERKENVNLFSIQEEWVFLIPPHTFNCMAKLRWPKNGQNLSVKFSNVGDGIGHSLQHLFCLGSIGGFSYSFILYSFSIHAKIASHPRSKCCNLHISHEFYGLASRQMAAPIT